MTDVSAALACYQLQDRHLGTCCVKPRCVVLAPAWWLPLCALPFTRVVFDETLSCCACAATNHRLRRDKLRKAHRVIKEQKRLERGGATQGMIFGEDVLDV